MSSIQDKLIPVNLEKEMKRSRMQIQETDGTYRDVEITQTGSCERDGDTCNHYRFEVDSADNYISPILYVEPMGRDVQFFVKLDMASAQAGTGKFVSEMISAEEPQPEEEPQTEEEPQVADEEQTTDEEQVTEKTNTNKVPVGQIAVGAVIVLVIGSLVVFVKKRK